MDNCVFCKIVRGEIPSEKLYEDDYMIVIKDLNPIPKLHYLMIPKEHYGDITVMTYEQGKQLGKCLHKLGGLLDGWGFTNGFRLVSNKGGDGCQSVGHLHVHILGGEKLSEKLC